MFFKSKYVLTGMRKNDIILKVLFIWKAAILVIISMIDFQRKSEDLHTRESHDYAV